MIKNGKRWPSGDPVRPVVVPVRPLVVPVRPLVVPDPYHGDHPSHARCPPPPTTPGTTPTTATAVHVPGMRSRAVTRPPGFFRIQSMSQQCHTRGLDIKQWLINGYFRILVFCQNGPEKRLVFHCFDVFEKRRKFRVFHCFPCYSVFYPLREHGINQGTQWF